MERVEKRNDKTIRLAPKGCKSQTDLSGWKNLNRKQEMCFSAEVIPGVTFDQSLEILWNEAIQEIV